MSLSSSERKQTASENFLQFLMDTPSDYQCMVGLRLFDVEDQVVYNDTRIAVQHGTIILAYRRPVREGERRGDEESVRFRCRLSCR